MYASKGLSPVPSAQHTVRAQEMLAEASGTTLFSGETAVTEPNAEV